MYRKSFGLKKGDQKLIKVFSKTLRGQSALEQIIITSLGLAFIAIIFYFSISFATDNTRVSQAQDTINKLANAADYVYALGPGSKDVVTVYMPEGMRYARVVNSTIQIRISLSSGDSDVFANTKAQLVGSLPQFSGPQDVTVTALSNGKIKFGDADLTCDPASITKTIEQGGSSSSSVTVKNVGDFFISGINASLGQIAGLVTAEVFDGASLGAGESDTIDLDFEIPIDQTVGTYSGFLTVSGSNESECATSVTVFVTLAGGPDLLGPIVSNIAHSPDSPRITTPITITGVGSDATTGGSAVSSCDLEIDYSGIWNNMGATDGLFNSVSENITLNIGTLGAGTHTVRLRCTDSVSNLGSSSSYSFLVNATATPGPGEGESGYDADILFVSHSASPGADNDENKWLVWIASHDSKEGFSWSINFVSRADLTAGSVNVSQYRCVFMANAPNSDADLYEIYSNYVAAGNYVIFAGDGMNFGPQNMGVGSSGASSNADKLKIRASNYVTQDFSVGSNITVVSAAQKIYYLSTYTGTNLASIYNYDTRISVGDGSGVLIFGPTNPTYFTTNGSLIFTRLLDYTMLNAG